VTPFAPSKMFVFKEPFDMRKSFEALSSAVENAFEGQLLTGSLFVFFNKTRNRVKVLYWDLDGLAIWYKRLEKGTFLKPTVQGRIPRRELLLMLEGKPKKRLSF
jgi:transposase